MSLDYFISNKQKSNKQNMYYIYSPLLRVDVKINLDNQLKQ